MPGAQSSYFMQPCSQRFPCQISDKWPSVSCPTPLNDRPGEDGSRWRFKVKMELRSLFALSVSLTHSPSSPKISQPMRRPSVRVRPPDRLLPATNLSLSLPSSRTSSIQRSGESIVAGTAAASRPSLQPSSPLHTTKTRAWVPPTT